MFKTLSSRLSAPFRIDGDHLDRYIKRRHEVVQGLWEDLILNDQIVIPVPDFLAACGLVLLIGEQNVINLLQKKRLHFAKARGLLGFVQGTDGTGALVVFSDPQRKRPQDCAIDQSISLGLSVIDSALHQRRLLEQLLVETTTEVELGPAVDSVALESIADFQKSKMWRGKYATKKKGLLALPGMKPMSVRVMSSTDHPVDDPVFALLSHANRNLDLYFADKFHCQNSSPYYPIGDLLMPKEKRVQGTSGRTESLRFLFEVESVPDISHPELSSHEALSRLVSITEGEEVARFRKWFHEADAVSKPDVVRAYFAEVTKTPILQRYPTKVIRFVLSSLIGAIPGIGAITNLAVGAFDTFVLDTLGKPKSPRTFVDSIKKQIGKG